MLQHPRLHVNLLRLVAAEREVQPGQRAVALHRLKFFAEEKVRRAALVAEEEPVLPRRARRAALFEERAERRDARAGADHNHRRVRVHGRAEVLVVMHEYRHRAAGRHAVGEERRAHALARAAQRIVAHHAHAEMHLAGVRLRAGGNRVEPRLELAQQRDELHRRELRRRVRVEQVNDFAAPDEFPQVAARAGRDVFQQLRVAGLFRQCLEQRLRDAGDFVVMHQRLAQRRLLAIAVGHRFFAGAAQCTEDFFGQLRAVRGPDGQRIARLVAEARAFERELKVPRVLRRAFAIELDVREQRRGEGMRLRVGGSCLSGGDNNHRRWRSGRCQCTQRAVHPLRKSLLILYVAVRARVDARRTELLEPLVHGSAERAKFRVVRVAERQH